MKPTNTNLSKKALSTFIKIVVTSLSLFWLYKQDYLNQASFTPYLNLKSVFLLSSIILAILFLQSHRLRLILQTKNNQTVFYFHILGQFFNFLLPSSVGGDIIKAHYLSKILKKTKTYTYLSIIYDRLLGLIGISLIGLIAFIPYLKQNPNTQNMILATVLSIPILVLMTSLLLEKKIKYPLLTKTIQHIKSVGILPFLLSLVIQLVLILFFVFVIQLDNAKIPNILLFTAAVSLSLIFTAIPISLGGIGLGQVTSFYFFQLLSPNIAYYGPVAFSLLQILQMLLGLLIFLHFMVVKNL